MQTAIEQITRYIDGYLQDKRQLLIAIDGHCAAGKTTLAAHLRELWGCNVFHMDDFFLRPVQRTEQRLQEPGGNIDHERFLQEVLIPLRENGNHMLSFRPYDCKTQTLQEPVETCPCPMNIIEGSYSCHPALWKYYDLHVFLSVGKEEQMRRVALRNGAAAEQFRDRWIPLEERYFSAFRIQERCELQFEILEQMVI